MFPGSQTAGIVTRVKGKEYRRLMPTYFFVLPLSKGSSLQGFVDMQGEGDAASRGVCMADPLGRFIYLLYFPQKQVKRAAITLQLKKSP
jgi:hypothetical protein